MHVELTASYCKLTRDAGDPVLTRESQVVSYMRAKLNGKGYQFHRTDPSNVGLTACTLGLRDAKAKIILWHERYQIEDAREAFNKGEVTFQRVNED